MFEAQFARINKWIFLDYRATEAQAKASGKLIVEEGSMAEFIAFPKMSRYSREVIVSEKIDGTNAQIYIGDGGEFLTGSRTKWITPEDDNYGFARWANSHKAELMELGPGRHFGEWWGQGIQRKYGLNEKRFSLFNVARWSEGRPECCHVVPVLWRGDFSDFNPVLVMDRLFLSGSVAAPGFNKPEGIVIFHTHANLGFKKTFDKDGTGKWDK
jgi:hypothetical protein